MKFVVINLIRTGSCALLLLAFLWLTAGSSYLSLAHQKQVSSKIVSDNSPGETENTPVPFEDGSNEQSDTNQHSFGVEFINENSMYIARSGDLLKHNKSYFSAFIKYFIGESVSPPPEMPAC